MEAKSKGECIELAIDSLMQLQEHYVEAVDWIEKSKAFVPDESKTIQELKDALAKSFERETELEQRLAASLARERGLTSYIGGLAKMGAEAESILEHVSNIGRILPAPSAQGSIKPTPHHPSPHLDQEKFKHTGTFRVAEEDQARQGLAKPVEQPTGAKFPPWYNANSEFKA